MWSVIGDDSILLFPTYFSFQQFFYFPLILLKNYIFCSQLSVNWPFPSVLQFHLKLTVLLEYLDLQIS